MRITSWHIDLALRSNGLRLSRARLSARRSRGVLATRGRLRYRSDGYQIVIQYRAEIMVSESHNRLRPAGSADKFHLERFGVVDLHNCTEITLSQSVLRKISIEYDRIQ